MACGMRGCGIARTSRAGMVPAWLRWRGWPAWPSSYLWAACAVVGVPAVWALLGPGWRATPLPYLTCYPVIIVAAWLGGLRLGLAATAVAVPLIGTFRATSWTETASVVLFAGVAVAIAGVGEALRGARRRTRDSETVRTVLEATMEHGPVGFALLDPDLRFVYANEALAALDGVRPEAHVGRRVIDVVPALWPQLAPVYGQVLTRGEPVLDVRVASASGGGGERRHWLASHYPIRMNGSLVGIGVVTADVTDGVRADERARRAEARYRALIDATTAIVWTADRDGAMLAAARWEAFTGQSREQVRGLGFLEAVHPDDRDEARRSWRQAVDARSAAAMSFRVRRRDGSYRRVAACAVPVRDDGGAVAEWVGTMADVDDTRHAAEQVQRAELQLRLALDTAGMLAWEWDLERDQVRRSPNAPRLLGRGFRSLGGTVRDWLDEVDPEDRAAVAAALHAAVADDGEYDVEYRVPRPDGAVRWLHDRGRVTERVAGVARRMIGAARDVTADRAAAGERDRLRDATARAAARAEAALETLAGVQGMLDEERAARREVERRARADAAAADRRLAMVLAGMRDGFCALDAAWRATHCNEPAAQLLGRPADALLEGALWELFPEVAGTALERECRRAVADVVPTRCELTWPATGVPLEVDAYPASDGGLALFVRDLTERRRAEAERAALEAAADAARRRLEEIVAQLPAGVVVVDAASGRVLLWNAEAERLGAGPGDEDAPALALDVAVADTRPHARALAQALATGDVVLGDETAVEARDGARSIVLVSAGPVHDADGRIVAAVATLVDVSERRRAEEALRDADRRKHEFLALLGRELRNPLATLRNAVIAARLDDARRERALDIARRQTDQLALRIDDLLDLARITQGRIELRRDRVFLAEVVERAVDAARPLVDTRGHALNVSLADENFEVSGDAARLQQVVVNLLSNAAQFSDPGGRIDLTLVRDGTDVLLRVRDLGIGIAADVLPRVFDLFAAGERGPDRAQGGLGVGLTVVRRLVELHGGSVAARSEGPGKGAEFLVRLPERTPRPDERGPRPLDVARPGARARILVVDDEPDAAESLTMLLQLLGHQVTVAHDGAAALEAARTLAPEIMLIDVGLPGVDGYELARRVRGDVGLMGVVLVALAAQPGDEDVQLARSAGFDHVLAKPVDLDTLQGLVGRIARRLRDETPTVH
jgi:PAS domain S-box-containing protein